MSGRTDLAEHLTATLPSTIRVIPQDDDPTISKTTVMVWTEQIATQAATGTFRLYTLNVLVMVPQQSKGDATLEDALEEVLEVIDLWDYPITWRTAKRSIYADKYPAFLVECESHVRRAYPGDNPESEED